jgi:hypothetical protein
MQSAADKAAEHLPLEVFSGRVTSMADRHVSTTVTTNKSSTATVNTIPEIWVAGERSEERRFTDTTVSECRPGHDVAIAIDRSKKAILALRNHSTGDTWFTHKLSFQETDGRYFIGMFAMAILLVLLSWIPSMLLFGENIGRRPWWADFWASLLQLFAFLLGIWIVERGRRKHNLKAEAIRDRVSAELAD